VHISTCQYSTCTSGNYESSCAHDWRDKKEKITRKFKLEDLKFDGYCFSSIFSGWLADIECYFDWHDFSEAAERGENS